MVGTIGILRLRVTRFARPDFVKVNLSELNGFNHKRARGRTKEGSQHRGHGGTQGKTAPFQHPPYRRIVRAVAIQ